LPQNSNPNEEKIIFFYLKKKKKTISNHFKPFVCFLRKRRKIYTPNLMRRPPEAGTPTRQQVAHVGLQPLFLYMVTHLGVLAPTDPRPMSRLLREKFEDDLADFSLTDLCLSETWGSDSELLKREKWVTTTHP
jgi:hypothetical protein